MSFALSALLRSRLQRFFVGPALALAFIGFGPHALAQPEEVVVTGVAPEKLEVHVESLFNISPEGQIARWREPLCLQTLGLPDAFADLQRERLSELADSVRNYVVNDGCQPNVLLFFTNDAATTTEKVFQHFDVSLRQTGQERVKDFRTSSAPVRWIATVDLCGFGCSLANSRISASSAPSIERMLLVVDAQQIQNRDFRDIADYVAFVALVNPAPNRPTALSSIMSLFDTPAEAGKPGGLSVYDELYLEALYSVPMNRFAEQQQTAIAGRMMTRLAELNQ